MIELSTSLSDGSEVCVFSIITSEKYLFDEGGGLRKRRYQIVVCRNVDTRCRETARNTACNKAVFRQNTDGTQTVYKTRSVRQKRDELYYILGIAMVYIDIH